jgi:hypothetical protein
VQTKIISSTHKLAFSALSFFGWISVSTNDTMKEIPMTAPKNNFWAKRNCGRVSV